MMLHGWKDIHLSLKVNYLVLLLCICKEIYTIYYHTPNKNPSIPKCLLSVLLAQQARSSNPLFVLLDFFRQCFGIRSRRKRFRNDSPLDERLADRLIIDHMLSCNRIFRPEIRILIDIHRGHLIGKRLCSDEDIGSPINDWFLVRYSILLADSFRIRVIKHLLSLRLYGRDLSEI